MTEEQIIELTPTQEDLLVGARYAAITLPWTFNRMMTNTGSQGQQSRALNIAKGIVAQEVLKRKFSEWGMHAELDRTSHREDDLFDFNIAIDGVLTKMDLKTIHYYSNYAIEGRPPLSKEIIVANQNYSGPDWRRFFPMLIPHTQIAQEKEVYTFAIASSIDIRNNLFSGRSCHALTAFTYGEAMAFLSSSKLCALREDSSSGFYLNVEYENSTLFSQSEIEIAVLGEWDGQKKNIRVKLSTDKTLKNIGPFSCFSSIQISKSSYDELTGTIKITVSKNDYKSQVLNSLRRNINQVPKQALIFRKEDFCNLILPNDFKLYFLGWISKEKFLERCENYSGWVWPIDKEDKFKNTPWSQITDKDVSTLTKAGFSHAIRRSPSRIEAGWLKTHGRGGGACCYVFPNIGRNGGVKETNLYVLPKDLNSFELLI
ncbi:MAG TPA: hypothetical protein VGN63_23040 [Flavisolibacter sp.]|nr:hypothetical protein [Flavisolibacter sp.]